ncbi:hypothetical protein ACIA59_17405 [Micromonospora haikouensis]|uniref:hypothetical protein n=1 Tax=Micromonospora haikouensis TaxID=686309 RepID=UPI00379D3DB5
MPELPIYEGWRAVPAGLFTVTQLADLDLPRVPGGPARAWVKTSNWRGKSDHFELYALAESVPSPATAAQLQAARARSFGSDHNGRVCGECGARPDRPVPELGHVTGTDHLPAGEADRARRLCLACARAVRLRAAVAAAAVARAEAARWAAGALAVVPPSVIRCAEVLRPPAPSGRRNLAPVALRVDAVDATGTELVRATIRLAGPRVKAVPADAVDLSTVEERIRSLLARPAVTWWTEELTPLLRVCYPEWRTRPQIVPYALRERATWWRGEIDPDTLTHRRAIDPTTAARTLLILRRMAATDSGAVP